MKAIKPKSSRLKNEPLIFSEDKLPCLNELQLASNLSAIFDECHNHIYANEGLLKDKIFHEIVKLLAIKLYDEQSLELKFGITASEYRNLLQNSSSEFESRINRLFSKFKQEHSSLFSDDSIRLKPLTLAFVVGKLQYISLANTSGDVKGEAFQSFIYRHQRGDRGEFFTPHPIVKMAVGMIAPQPNETVLDPACGSGGFLIEAIKYVGQHNSNLNKAGYIRQHLRGVEFNPDVALSATIRLSFEGGDGNEIICTNALSENALIENSFDVILTNPPFGSKGKVEDIKTLNQYALARKWKKVENNSWKQTQIITYGQSPDILFIEKCLRLLRPNGRMAIVVPDGILQNLSNGFVRFWMRSQAKVLGVVSIPSEAFVPYGTGIKTSLLLLQKLPAQNSESCFMAQMQKVGYDVKGQSIYRRDSTNKFLADSSGCFIVDDDVEEIVTVYNQFQKSDFAIQNDKHFVMSENELNSRLDVEHYLPSDKELVEYLKSVGARPLCEVTDILNESDDFRSSSNDEIRYIAISDVDSRTMQVVSQQTLKAYEAPSRAIYRVQTGDIITATSGASTGTHKQATAFITEDEDGAICSNGFAVLRNIRNVEPLFLLAYLRTNSFLRQTRRLMTGHAIPAISNEDLSKIFIPIPSLKEQLKIAESIASIQSMRRQAMKEGERLIKATNSLIEYLKKAETRL